MYFNLYSDCLAPIEQMSPEEAAVAVYFSNVAYGFDGQVWKIFPIFMLELIKRQFIDFHKSTVLMTSIR